MIHSSVLSRWQFTVTLFFSLLPAVIDYFDYNHTNIQSANLFIVPVF